MIGKEIEIADPRSWRSSRPTPGPGACFPSRASVHHRRDPPGRGLVRLPLPVGRSLVYLGRPKPTERSSADHTRRGHISNQGSRSFAGSWSKPPCVRSATRSSESSTPHREATGQDRAGRPGPSAANPRLLRPPRRRAAAGPSRSTMRFPAVGRARLSTIASRGTAAIADRAARPHRHHGADASEAADEDQRWPGAAAASADLRHPGGVQAQIPGFWRSCCDEGDRREADHCAACEPL
jgi:hypothetical protein